MELDRAIKEKLTRYLLNANPFLWNVLDGKNKKDRLQELKGMGFLAEYPDKTNANYNKIIQDLLVELGIEVILRMIVVPKIRALFTSDIISYFRRCWEQGQTPTLKYLREQGLYHRTIRQREVYEGRLDFYEEPPSGYKDASFIFVQIETQHNFVERWTVFAGLWFEEIEALPYELEEQLKEEE
ncbi:hypothetical protein ACFLUP_04585 [Chloroflexota bacterium]